MKLLDLTCRMVCRTAAATVAIFVDVGLAPCARGDDTALNCDPESRADFTCRRARARASTTTNSWSRATSTSPAGKRLQYSSESGAPWPGPTFPRHQRPRPAPQTGFPPLPRDALRSDFDRPTPSVLRRPDARKTTNAFVFSAYKKKKKIKSRLKNKKQKCTHHHHITRRRRTKRNTSSCITRENARYRSL